MRSTSVVLFFCPLCFVLTVLNITLLSCQAWDGWTPPVTTSIASKALSIKDHAFAPAAGTAEVAGWTPVTSVATVAASSLSAHSSGECSMGSVSKGLSIKDHAFVPAAGATGWTEHAAADGRRAFYYHANSQTLLFNNDSCLSCLSSLPNSARICCVMSGGQGLDALGDCVRSCGYIWSLINRPVSPSSLLAAQIHIYRAHSGTLRR